MFHLQAWATLTAVVLGNFGFWLFCFNRINATGLSRHKTKKIEKLFILASFVIPLVIAAGNWQPLVQWLLSPSAGWWPMNASWFDLYGAWCLACTFVLGPPWLESRRWILPPKHLTEMQSERHQVHASIEGGSPGDRLTGFLNMLPGNEISDLEVTRKVLELPRSIRGVDGLKVGHISDLHFTGQLRQEHYEFVLDRFMELEPDLIFITGDIIDYDHCLPWVKPLFGKLRAPYGCAYVLGNHDRRVIQLDRFNASMDELGHFDLGREDRCLRLDSGTRVEMLGNELPWLRRHQQTDTFDVSSGGRSSNLLRIGVSHSPDQLGWARRRNVDLLLAGHTHGGQVRFPGIGPIVAPSWHGSRFASGVFYRDPTLMHVSRGVAGTHPLRWRCAPEVSLLTLRQMTSAMGGPPAAVVTDAGT